jgi:hypothetical protein
MALVKGRMDLISQTPFEGWNEITILTFPFLTVQLIFNDNNVIIPTTAFIDTGSTISVVDAEFARIHSPQIISQDGMLLTRLRGQEDRNAILLRFGLDVTEEFRELIVTDDDIPNNIRSTDLGEVNFIIGSDILRFCQFLYNGRTNDFILDYTPPVPTSSPS